MIDREELRRKIATKGIEAATVLRDCEESGYVQLEWLRMNAGEVVQIDDQVNYYLDNAEKLGWEIDDITIRWYISTHNQWYNWFDYELSNPVLGKVNNDNHIMFPSIKTMPKSFIEPLLEREVNGQLRKQINSLADKYNNAMAEIKRLKSKLETLGENTEEDDE